MFSVVFKLALIQLAVTSNKQTNWRRAAEMIEKAVGLGAKLVCLPVSDMIVMLRLKRANFTVCIS